MGNYQIVFGDLCDLLNFETVMPPPITKRTIELGSKHSPEFVCVPFKYNLGGYIESLDKGAEVLIQGGGGCRFGYYGEVQEEILKDLGYKFEFLKLTNSASVLVFLKDFKSLNPKLTNYQLLRGFLRAYLKIRAIDIAEEIIRKNIGFEKEKGELEKIEKSFLGELKKVKTVRGIYRVRRVYLRAMKKVEIEKPENPLRVGIVGEFYLLMEPFSNYFLEKSLGKRGIEVHRFITISSWLKHGIRSEGHRKHLLKHADPYLKYHVGAHGTESVALAHELYKDGFDGIIHVKPFGCMPEVNAMASLQRISKEKKFPIMYFSFDSQTSETGIQTRLEAFYDMLMMRKQNEKS